MNNEKTNDQIEKPYKSKKKQDEMTFFEHLGELRKRVLYSVGYILLFFMVAWNFKNQISTWLAVPMLKYLPKGGKLAVTAPTEAFMMYVKISFIAGLFIAAPFIFHQLWKFISPALYKKEKRMVWPFVIGTTVCFLAGGAFGYYFAFPWACKFFIEIGLDYQQIITVNEYYSLATNVLLGIAIVFELPVLSYLLAKFGILTSRFLLKYFRYAIVLIFVVSAIITPTPDAVTQSMFAVPMIVLYLLSILIVKFVEPKDK